MTRILKRFSYLLTIFLFILSPLAMAADLIGPPDVLPELPPLPPPPSIPTCSDGIQNGNEEGVDCGGICKACTGGGPNPCIALACPPQIQAHAAVCGPQIPLTDVQTLGALASNMQLTTVSCPTPGDVCNCVVCEHGTHWDANARRCIKDGIPPIPPLPEPGGDGTCRDRIQNGLEEGVDCGGPTCRPCRDRDVGQCDRSQSGRTNHRDNGDRSTSGRENNRDTGSRDGQTGNRDNGDRNSQTGNRDSGSRDGQTGNRNNEVQIQNRGGQATRDDGTTTDRNTDGINGNRNGGSFTGQTSDRNTGDRTTQTGNRDNGDRLTSGRTNNRDTGDRSTSGRTNHRDNDPCMTGFSLIDANTNREIPGFDPIPSGARINLAEIGVQNVNVRFNEEAGSVRMSANGEHVRTESFEPFSLGGDRGGDFNNFEIRPGENTVRAEPYDFKFGLGQQREEKEVTFFVEDGSANTMRVTGFTLMDADTDRPVPGFDPIPDGAEIDLTKVPQNLNVRANTADGVGSVRMSVNGQVESVENIEPFSLGRENAGDFETWDRQTNDVTLEATPFSRTNAQGERGQSSSIRVSFVEPPQIEGLVDIQEETPVQTSGITSFTLIDTNTNKALPGLSHVTASEVTVDRASLGIQSINVQANTGGDVQSVQFTLDGVPTRLENTAPWSLMGDENGRFSAWEPSAGTYTVGATPYTETRGRGDEKDSRTLTIRVQ